MNPLSQMNVTERYEMRLLVKQNESVERILQPELLNFSFLYNLPSITLLGFELGCVTPSLKRRFKSVFGVNCS